MMPREVVVSKPGVSISIAMFPSSRLTEAFPSRGANFAEVMNGRKESVENELVGALAMIGCKNRENSLNDNFVELISLQLLIMSRSEWRDWVKSNGKSASARALLERGNPLVI